MPIISTFFGIVIRVFYKEHKPPHFHAEYHGQNAKFTFDGELLAGEIQSGTVRQLIRDWALLHRVDLEANIRTPSPTPVAIRAARVVA